MNHVSQSLSAAIAEPCIQINYKGQYAYAAAVLVVSTPAAPVLSLGVSDTSLADAVSNAATVITGDGTLTLRDVVAAIKLWNASTASHVVNEGEFEAVLWNAIYSDVFGGSSSPYAAAAGTLNLKNTNTGILIIDNDVAGYTSLRIPAPSVSNGPVAISNIQGFAGSSGTPTVTRAIYDLAGNVVAAIATSVASATSDLLNPHRPTFWNPTVLANGPVVVRDTCATPAHNTATTMTVEYQFPNP